MARVASSGGGSDLAVELVAAAEAAVACNADTVSFVNECEPICGRFCRALTRVKQQKFSDEEKLLESIRDKEQLVHFLFDCVRNRFLLRDRIGYAKRQLTDGSRMWEKAFRDHVKKCATCGTVDLRGPQPPSVVLQPVAAPQYKYPIPFCLELAALSGLALPVIVWVKGANCYMQWVLLVLGLLLMVPLLVFMSVRCYKKQTGWPLGSFISGNYSANSQFRPLGRLWVPSKFQAMEAEDSRPAGHRKACFTFGWWFLRPEPQTDAIISMRSDAQPAESDTLCSIAVSSGSCHWVNSPAQLQASGALQGLSRQVSFDGANLLIGPNQSQVLMKIGCWRLDFVVKLLAVLAVIGFWLFIAVLAFPPRLQSCSAGVYRRLPLKAVFLMDGSGSMSGAPWKAEKQAVKAIVGAFQDVYAQDSGSLHLGVAQFSTTVTSEIAITSDIQGLLAKVSGIQQVSGGTKFAGALRLCQKELDAYTLAGPRTFDLCVLITDGANSDPASNMAGLPVRDTALFGIYVGQDSAAEASLRDLSTCGEADHSPGCHFFASAASFSDLRDRAEEVAKRVTKGSDKAGGADIQYPRWVLLFLLALLPFLAWWVYIQRQRRAIAPIEQAPRTEQPLREPLRLHTAHGSAAR